MAFHATSKHGLAPPAKSLGNTVVTSGLGPFVALKATSILQASKPLEHATKA